MTFTFQTFRTSAKFLLPKKRPRLRNSVQLNWLVKMLDSPNYTEIERMQFCFSAKNICALPLLHWYKLQLLRQILETRIKSPCSCDHVGSLTIFGAISLFESVVAINTYGTCPFYDKCEKYLEHLCFSQEMSNALVLVSLGKFWFFKRKNSRNCVFYDKYL